VEKNTLSHKTIRIGSQLLTIDRPLIAGIINLTPDSFYGGSRSNNIKAFLEKCEAMLSQGADMLDIGAFSSRPFAQSVSQDEEIKRLLAPLAEFRRHFPETPVSVDSFRSEVVKQIYDTIGDFLVNDISGGQFDADLFDTVGSLHLPYVLMHVQGTFETMHQEYEYKDIVESVSVYFAEKTVELHQKGVGDVLLDPGFGFSKNMHQNFELFSRLNELLIHDKPLYIGISRKSMIYITLGIAPEDALNGTTFLHAHALAKGASILRVHDVKEAMEAVKLDELLRGI